MNYKLLSLCVGIFFLVGAIAYGSSVLILNNSTHDLSISSLEKGLVGHWTLDGVDYNSNTNRVTDKSAYANHGINNGATLTTDRLGNSEGAMSFDGSASFTTDKIFSDDINQEWTVTGWVYLDRNDVDQYFNNFNRGNKIIHSSTKKALLYANSGDNDHYTYSSGTIPTGQWLHFSYVYRTSDRTCKFYLNGEFDKSSTNYHEADVPSGFSSSTIFGQSFDGKMDDVRVYNRALSDEEIKLLYDSYKPKVVSGSTQKGLILDMPLKYRYTKSETTGSEIMTDRTPYSNDGTNHNAVVGEDFTSFEGSSWVGEIEDPNFLEPEAITVSSWINMDVDAPTDRNIWLTKWYGYSMEITADTRIPYFRLRGPGDTVSNTSLTLGQWHHFVGTYDSSIGGRVYLDGNLVGTRSTSTAITYSRSFPLNIGRYAGGIYFKGDISDVKIYDRAITASEVRSLYDRGRI